METNSHAEFGAKSLTTEFRKYAHAETLLIRKAFTLTFDERAEGVKVVLLSTCGTAVAIAELSKHSDRFYADAVVLARAFIETVINFIYLQICDQSEYDKYKAHTVQKAYRKLDRKVVVGGIKIGIKFSGASEFLNKPEVKAALDEFTSDRGREKTRWTALSLTQRLEIISSRASIDIRPLMLSTLDIYEDASETLHGTLYGATYRTWAYEPTIDRTNPYEVEAYTQKKVSLLFIQIGVLYHQVLLLLNKQNVVNKKLSGIVKASQENTDRAFDMLKKGILSEEDGKTLSDGYLFRHKTDDGAV